MGDWSEELSAALASGDPRYMKAMLAQVPGDVLAVATPYIHQMGRLNLEEGRLEEALTCYEELVRIAPTRAQWYEQRAEVRLRLGRPAEALADARRAAELQPDSALARRLEARALEESDQPDAALQAYRAAARLEPGDATLADKVRELEHKVRQKQILSNLLQNTPPSAAEAASPPPRAALVFDPAQLDDPAVPPALEGPALRGLKQHLTRYGEHQGPRSVITRLEDPVWLAAWEQALSQVSQAHVLCHGSELGVLALRALQAGASRVTVIESSPLGARVAGGVIQKNRLMAWHASRTPAELALSDNEKEASFESFSADIRVLAPGAAPADAPADCFLFPDIDHTLLGTGLVSALRRLRESGAVSAGARLLPGRARVFAMGIGWRYPGSPFDLDPIGELRWSPAVEALELDPDAWVALTDSVCVSEIDLAAFTETRREFQLPVHTAGRLEGIVYWFELELGAATLSNAPGSPLRCIRPAIQYTDPVQLAAGDVLPLEVLLTETRLHMRPQPPPRVPRSARMPVWYVPMLIDRPRNEAYERALKALLAERPIELALDIGAGCGLLSLMAVHAGAQHALGCEVRPSLARIARQVIDRNGYGGRITVLNKDSRALQVGEELPRRADLALFEIFDCTLLGEGVLHFLAHAREHLLEPGARYLPLAGRIRGQVVQHRFDRLLGSDVNLLNAYRYAPGSINVDAAALAYTPLSEPFDVFSFDFATATPQPQEAAITAEAQRAGVAGAVLFWFDLQMTADSWLSNAPGASPALHWKQALQFLPEVSVQAGAPIPLAARHDGSAVSFHWREAEVDRASVSRLPRFDPRAFTLASELESQTQQVLRHCLSHPEEHERVGRLASLFAIDPGAHGLDPRIARRFAAILFDGN